MALTSSVPAPAVADDFCTTQPNDPLCSVFGSLSTGSQTTLDDFAAEVAQTPVGSLADSIPPVATPAVNSGLFTGDDVGTPPVPPDMFVRSNAWTSPTLTNTSTITTIWAGASYVDPTLGMVVVATYDAATQQLQSVNAITEPSNDGALTVTGGYGQTITLVAVDGTSWIFDSVVGHLVQL